jgi:hypothetical protein
MSLAADNGEGRADSLLAIHGAGPDYVRQRIPVLDSALGIFSPGIPGLHELIRKVERAVSAPSTVKHQHVISEVVLRRFAGPVPSKGRWLACFDLAAGQCALAKSEDVGYVEHFVPVDSQATEDLWHAVETRLRPAIKAARGGTALGNPVHAATLMAASRVWSADGGSDLVTARYTAIPAKNSRETRPKTRPNPATTAHRDGRHPVPRRSWGAGKGVTGSRACRRRTSTARLDQVGPRRTG